MYLKRRLIPRTDGPQPVYKTAVDAAVRTWMPAAALVLACAVTPQRATLDVRGYEWGQPVCWAPPVIDASVQQWQPAAATARASFRTSGRPTLDVRGSAWTAPESSWLAATFTPTVSVAQQWPAVLLGSGQHVRTAARPALDVRGYDWTTSTLQTPTPALDAVVSQQAPAWVHTGRRTPDQTRLDVRVADWVQRVDWLSATLSPPPTTAQIWPAILLNAGLSYTTAGSSALDVRRHEWAPSFGLASAIDTSVLSWMPAVAGGELASARTRDGVRLDMRRFGWSPDSAWLFTAQPPPVPIAQTWPAVWLGTGTQYQTAQRAKLDVRGHEWASSFGLTPVVDGVVSGWSPSFTTALQSERRRDGVRLDLRRSEWAPAFAWVAKAIDAQVASWMPAVAGEHGSVVARRNGRGVDGRRYEWAPQGGWASATLAPPPTTAQIWPAVVQGAGLSYRVGSRRSLDVRLHEWATTFSRSSVVDGSVRAWMPAVAGGELASFRTREGATIDMRGLGWSPDTAWLFIAQPPPVPIVPWAYGDDVRLQAVSVARPQLTEITAQRRGRLTDVTVT